MTTQEINAALSTLSAVTRELEEAYIENGGEVTDLTEEMEQSVTAIKELLTTEGVDSLGRWLKAKQDEIATAKAEKAAADARIKSLQKTEEYIKGYISLVLRTTDTDKVKGSFYSFAQSTSVKSTLNGEALDDAYLSKVLVAARTAGLPDCIDVELKTTTTRLKEAGEEFEQYISVETAPSVRFGKPRAAKD